MDGDLTDAQWALLEPLLPLPPHPGRGGRPRYRSRRELIDGIRWRFREQARWDRMPPRYGPHQTTSALFHAWHKDGTWERLAVALGAGPEARTIMPWVDLSRGGQIRLSNRAARSAAAEVRTRTPVTRPVMSGHTV
jgi:transposase